MLLPWNIIVLHNIKGETTDKHNIMNKFQEDCEKKKKPDKEIYWLI